MSSRASDRNHTFAFYLHSPLRLALCPEHKLEKHFTQCPGPSHLGTSLQPSLNLKHTGS